MSTCPQCEREFVSEAGLRRHVTRMHGRSASPFTSTEPTEDIDVSIGVQDDEPVEPPPLPPVTPRRPRKKAANLTPADANQIADMLLMMFDGIMSVSVGEYGKLDKVEHEYIDPALNRLIARHLPEQMSEKASSYADLIMLCFGFSLYGIRVYRINQHLTMMREHPPVPFEERFQQKGRVEQPPPVVTYAGPMNNTPEADVLRTVQSTNGRPVGGETPIGVVPPLWDDTSGMVDDIPRG